MKHVSAANYLGILDKCLQECGVSNFLKDIGLERVDVHDPTVYLNFDELKFILLEAYRLSQCSHLGLLFGEHLSIGNHGFLGYATMTSPTLRMAIQTFLNFIKVRTSLLQGKLCVDKAKTAFIELKLFTDEPVIVRFLTEIAVVHLTHLRRFLINAETPFLRIDIAYPKPPYAPYYYRSLHTSLVFDAMRTRLWLRPEELEYPINFADDASCQQAKRQLHTLAQQMCEEDTLPERIRQCLYAEDNYRLTMEQLAQSFCLSARTLRRHLARHQVSFQELFEEVRCQKAKDYLLKTRLSITEISFRLGFHDSSNFSKAFKRWTSLTPTDYREQHAK